MYYVSCGPCMLWAVPCMYVMGRHGLWYSEFGCDSTLYCKCLKKMGEGEGRASDHNVLIAVHSRIPGDRYYVLLHYTKSKT